MFTHILLIATSLLLLVLAAGIVQAREPDAVVVRSLISRGDPALMHRVFARGLAGQPIVLGAIGGSMTQANGVNPTHRYANLVAAHLRKMFPKSQVSLVNAGIGATGTTLGCLRVGRDLLSQHPDLVICEFAMNWDSPETFEGLTRQILASPNHPAVIYLILMDKDGNCAQAWQSKIAQHYHLPLVSYHDALWPEIQSGRLTFADLSNDGLHPNDRGHMACAQFVNHLLDLTFQSQPADTPPSAGGLPAPLLTGLFDHTAIFEAAALTPTHNDGGWELDVADECWHASRPGSTIEFVVDGRYVAAMYHRLKSDYGQVSAQVDDGPPTVLDAWFEGAWGGFRQTTPVGENLPAGKHRVKLTLLKTKSPQSTGHEFKLLGLGTAGTAEETAVR